MEERETKKIIEALIFAADSPLSIERIKETLENTNGLDVEKVIAELNREYEESGRAFVIRKVGGGYLVTTTPEFSDWIKRLYVGQQKNRLSQAALETLSIIAFKQPVSRVDIAQIRGVNSDGVIGTLLERKLIKISGRSEAVGRPLLYSTTPEFLQFFGINDLSELPKPREIQELVEREGMPEEVMQALLQGDQQLTLPIDADQDSETAEQDSDDRDEQEQNDGNSTAAENLVDQDGEEEPAELQDVDSATRHEAQQETGDLQEESSQDEPGEVPPDSDSVPRHEAQQETGDLQEGSSQDEPGEVPPDSDSVTRHEAQQETGDLQEGSSQDEPGEVPPDSDSVTRHEAQQETGDLQEGSSQDEPDTPKAAGPPEDDSKNPSAPGKSPDSPEMNQASHRPVSDTPPAVTGDSPGKVSNIEMKAPDLEAANRSPEQAPVSGIAPSETEVQPLIAREAEENNDRAPTGEANLPDSSATAVEETAAVTVTPEDDEPPVEEHSSTADAEPTTGADSWTRDTGDHENGQPEPAKNESPHDDGAVVDPDGSKDAASGEDNEESPFFAEAPPSSGANETQRTAAASNGESGLRGLFKRAMDWIRSRLQRLGLE